MTREVAATTRQALCARLGVSPARKLVLLATSDLGTPSKRVRYPFIDWADAVRQIEKLGHLAARHPEWAFLLRGHPRYDHPVLYERFVRRGSDAGSLVRTSDCPPAQLLPGVDVIVVVNAITSAIVEFSHWNKPLFLLLPSAIWCDRDEWLTGAWPHLDSIADLETELERVFRAPEQYNTRVAETAAAMRRFFDGPPTPSIPRCIDAIRRLAATRPVPDVRRPQSQLCPT